ncbi:MAG TPA: co-chaperone GroES [Rhabdochlamydiaceae bacterium]
MTEKIIPFGKRVLALRIKPAEKTASGIIIPDSSQKKQDRAVVEAIADELMDSNGIPSIPIHIGATVLIEKYAGREVDGYPDLVLLKLDEIMGLVENG